VKFSVFQVSRKGGRAKNEDRMGYCYTRESGLFLLADGMGGHPEGEVAAQLALQSASALYQKQAQPSLPNVTEFLTAAILAAHEQILRYAGRNGMLDSPRTTFVAAVVQGSTATWVHCGDSRLYVVRDGLLLTRTRDHSYAEQSRSDGRAPPGPVNRNVLYTCLGASVRPVFDITGPIVLHQGDKIMLCSDGLWDSLPDEDIVRVLCQSPVSEAVPDLVEQALRKAGPTSDNVTVMAIEWETPDPFESTRGISTESIQDGVFASSIQAGGPGSGLDELDDAAIERSIAEINEAIRRSAIKRG
jgi:serine/threonine protein phosphatase PrpC